MPLRKSSEQSDPNRFIVERGGTFHYKRRVPASVADADDRAPHVRVTLKTRDLALARHKRDALEAADDAFWASLLNGDGKDLAKLRHSEAVKRSEAMGFAYRSIDTVGPARLGDLLNRLDAVADDRTPRATSRAVLGLVDPPRITLTEGFTFYLEEIAPSIIAGKSDEQRRQWTKVMRRAINNFRDINGEIAMDDIAREHAIKVYDLWRRRIAPTEAGVRQSHSPSSGNRDLSSMRGFYRDYWRRLGQRDRPNPFDDLSFSERQRRQKRPPFPTEWIRDRLLAKGALASFNDEARGAMLAMVETGMRPSEVVNLKAEHIVLNHKVPHVLVEPRDDPEDPREVKSNAAVRMIPLLGVSLAAFKKFPTGFDRYRDKSSSLSAIVNKQLRKLGLMPTPRHVLYSLRHSFEDRMKDGAVDAELRKILMGHALDRPEYGTGGSLELRRKALAAITLRFDVKSV